MVLPLQQYRCFHISLIRSISLALLIAAIIWVALSAMVSATSETDWVTTETIYFRIEVQSSTASSANAFATQYGSDADLAFEDLTSFFHVIPTEQLTIRVFTDDQIYNDAVIATGRVDLPNQAAFADPANSTILISLNQLATKTPLESENDMRHAVAHLLVNFASGGSIPLSLEEGIALYVERPVVPRLARHVALVQGANQDKRLLTWFDLNQTQTLIDNPDLLAAQSYALTDFLLSHYRISRYQQFLQLLTTAPTWQQAVQEAYGAPPAVLERQWRDNLPQWAAGEWRNNLTAGFDFDPAQQMIAQGNYLGAKQALAQSQQLFSELDDREKLATIQVLIAQCDTGIQAEALMQQVQQALEQHTYERADALLTQARTQYNLLPPKQRPLIFLDTYQRLTQTGLDARQHLDLAMQQEHRWSDYPTARSAALTAGKLYAELGDEQMYAETQMMLDRIDNRQRRIVMLLGAVVILLFVWLALWLRGHFVAALDWK